MVAVMSNESMVPVAVSEHLLQKLMEIQEGLDKLEKLQWMKSEAVGLSTTVTHTGFVEPNSYSTFHYEVEVLKTLLEILNDPQPGVVEKLSLSLEAKRRIVTYMADTLGLAVVEVRKITAESS